MPIAVLLHAFTGLIIILLFLKAIESLRDSNENAVDTYVLESSRYLHENAMVKNITENPRYLIKIAAFKNREISVTFEIL